MERFFIRIKDFFFQITIPETLKKSVTFKALLEKVENYITNKILVRIYPSQDAVRTRQVARTSDRAPAGRSRNMCHFHCPHDSCERLRRQDAL